MLKKVSFSLLILFLASLLFIAFFNRFQADDYVLAWDFNHFGAWGSIKNTYLNWSGRYFAFTFIKLTPLLYHQYNIYPSVSVIISILFLWLGIFLLLKNYFGNNIKKSIEKAIVFCGLYFLLSLNLSEHLYWHSGAKVYLFPFIYLLFFLNIIVLNNIKQKKIYFPILYLLSFMIIGSNEIIAIMFCSLLFFLQRKNKIYQYLLGFSLILLTISIIAPGNFIRLGYKDPQPLLKTIKNRFLLFGALHFVALIKSIFLIPLFHLFFKKEIKTLHANKLSFKIALIAFLGICAVTIFGVSSQRTSDTYLIFYLVGLATLIYKKHDLQKWSWMSLIIICLPSFKIVKKIATINYHVYDATIDIINIKSLNKFKEQVIERESYLEQSTEDSIGLKPIKNAPKTLYFHKIGTADNRNFGNDQLEKYYNKKSIHLKND